MNRRSFLSRSARLAAASLAPSLLAGCGGMGAGGGHPPDLTVRFDGRSLSREDVLQWEARRLRVIAQRLNGNLPGALLGELGALLLRPEVSIATIDEDRIALARAKLLAGEDEMRRVVATDVLLTNQISELSVATVPGWSVSEIDIASSRGTAEGFADWFTRKSFDDDPYAMLVACPDHFVLRPVPPTGQEVIEITGGAVQASRFVIGYDDVGDLPIVIDPAFPVRFSGAARNTRDTVIGGVNHRFRTLPTGFDGHLAIFFPAALPAPMVAEHRWHLACEFSNWITAYIEETGD